MDVIALHQAGFTGAVAPLGTALTEEQLEELWRLTLRRCSVSTAMPPARVPPPAAPISPCRCWRPTGRCGSPRCRRARTPIRWCAARATRASRACSTPRARWPRRCMTCCARPGASGRRSSGRRSAPGWKRRRAASRTERRPTNIVPHCSRTIPCRRPAVIGAQDWVCYPGLYGLWAPGHGLLNSGPGSFRPAAIGPITRAIKVMVRPAPGRPLCDRPPPVPNASPHRRRTMRASTAILLRHPNLLHMVDHADAALTLLPALDRLRSRVVS